MSISVLTTVACAHLFAALVVGVMIEDWNFCDPKTACRGACRHLHSGSGEWTSPWSVDGKCAKDESLALDGYCQCIREGELHPCEVKEYFTGNCARSHASHAVNFCDIRQRDAACAFGCRAANQVYELYNPGEITGRCENTVPTCSSMHAGGPPEFHKVCICFRNGRQMYDLSPSL